MTVPCSLRREVAPGHVAVTSLASGQGKDAFLLFKVSGVRSLIPAARGQSHRGHWPIPRSLGALRLLSSKI